MRKDPLICDSVFMLPFIVYGKWVGAIPLPTVPLARFPSSIWQYLTSLAHTLH